MKEAEGRAPVAPRAACAPNIIKVEGRDVGEEQCEGTKLHGHIPSVTDAEPPAAITQKSWDQGKNPSSPLADTMSTCPMLAFTVNVTYVVFPQQLLEPTNL